MDTPLVDPSQPITAADPRVAQILAMIQAKAAQSQVAPNPSTPLTAQVANPNDAPPPAQPQMQMPATPQLAMPPAPNVAPEPPSQPGPIKSFLQSLVSNLGGAAYQGTQGALQKLGIPTDYEKQQNALKIGLQQQSIDAQSAERQSTASHLDALTQATIAGQGIVKIPTDAKYGGLAGQSLPATIAIPYMQKMETLANQKAIASGNNATTISGKQIQFGPESYLRRSVQSIGGRMVSIDKGDPGNKDLQVDLGPATPMITGPMNAEARARAQAQYGLTPSVDANGNPISISRLQALQTGAPNVNFSNAKGVISDLVGVKQYQDILDNKITPNLRALDDPAQRIAIAHTLSEADKNPGALQALITSGLQSNALTPQGAALAAGIMQGREFGGVARKYGGNMNGTEGLMNRIMANQASPLNSGELNTDLIQNDRAFTDKALQSIVNLRSNSSATQPKTASPTTQHPFFSQFGGVTK